MQFVLLYFQPFHRNLLLKCALQSKIAKKNSTKPLVWGFKLIQGHRL